MITKNRAKCKSALPITPRPKGFKKIPLRCKAYNQNQNPSTKNGQSILVLSLKSPYLGKPSIARIPQFDTPKAKTAIPKDCRLFQFTNYRTGGTGGRRWLETFPLVINALCVSPQRGQLISSRVLFPGPNASLIR